MGSAAQEVGVRAPARLTIEDCLCQCDSQTFVDKFNRLNGDCKSADGTGKRWCYLKDVDELIGTYRKSHSSWNSFTTVRAPSPVTTTCRDGKTSQQFQGKVFGYHACGTPELEDNRYYAPAHVPEANFNPQKSKKDKKGKKRAFWQS